MKVQIFEYINNNSIKNIIHINLSRPA
jgi:hypothetical protein